MRTDLRADVAGLPAPGAPRLVAGVDVVDVGRFEQLLLRRGAALLDHVFTPGELGECAGRPESLAARLAAKEATLKALGTGIGPVAWRDVEVRRGPGGAPVLVLTGGARAVARSLGLGDWAVSLSHDAGCAVAVVVALHGGASRGGAPP